MGKARMEDGMGDAGDALKLFADIWRMIDELPQSKGGSYSLDYNGDETREEWIVSRVDSGTTL